MRDIDNIDRIFREFDRIMDGGFTGGYTPNPSGPSSFGNPMPNDDRKPGVIFESETLEILEDEKNIYFTMELRGVSDEDLTVIPKDESIGIEVMLDGKWIKRDYSLYRKINPKTSKITFNNCILDVILKKIKE